MPQQVFAYKDQPWKALYLAYTLSSVLIHLPFWTITAAIPAWRPRPSWTFGRTIIYRIFNVFAGATYKVGYMLPASNPDIDSRKPDETGFVWVEPLPPNIITGEIARMAKVNEVEAIRVWGYWMGEPDERGKHGYPARANERVLLHIHGGSHTTDSAQPKAISSPVRRGILKHGQNILTRAFAVEHRLASSEPFKRANPFPASLLDTLAGYRYLVETLRFEPRNVIVCGDSSGAHVAINMARYLVQSRFPSLPIPGALILLSPAGDWALTHAGTPGYTMEENEKTDVTGNVFKSGYTVRSILGNVDKSEIATNPWFSPASLLLPTASGLFTGFPPSLTLASGAEQPVDAMRTLRDRLVADCGAERATYIEYPDAFHDWLVHTWHEPERTSALMDITKFLSQIYHNA